MNDTLASRLKRLRQQANLTQVQLAALTKQWKPGGLDRSLISKIESGKRVNPGLETLQTLALALGCLIDDLMPASPSAPVSLRKGTPEYEVEQERLRQLVSAKIKSVQDPDVLKRVLEYIEFLQGRK